MATESKTTTAEKKVKTVTIRLPLTRTEKDDVYVAHNGKRYQIKRGVSVEVPWYIAKILERQEKMLSIAMAYEEQAAEQLQALIDQK